LTGGGWFTTYGSSAPANRIHFALSADGSATPPSGSFGYRDPVEGLDLRLDTYATMTVSGTTVTLTGTVRHADGTLSPFRLTATDGGEPGHGQDTLRLQLLDRGYSAEGTVGGGNLQLHR
jgi:hypothetical protein